MSFITILHLNNNTHIYQQWMYNTTTRGYKIMSFFSLNIQSFERKKIFEKCILKLQRFSVGSGSNRDTDPKSLKKCYQSNCERRIKGCFQVRSGLSQGSATDPIFSQGFLILRLFTKGIMINVLHTIYFNGNGGQGLQFWVNFFNKLIWRMQK